jgi:LysR family glycine cleavage system transcriptional activator
MKRRLPPLSALRAFDAAARHASFARAAEELHVTPGAISRQIKTLEDFLRQQLFERHTRKIELTDFGHLYFSSTSNALDEIEHSTIKALGTRARLHVSIIPTTATLWLLPRLASFTEAHNDIEIDVHTSIKPVDFEKDDIDVAVRVGQRPGQYYSRSQPRIPHKMVTNWKGVIARHLRDEILVPVCSPALLDSKVPLKTLADLRHHTLLHVASRENAWADWLRAAGHAGLRGKHDIEFGHFFMALQAAGKARGIALASTLHVENFEGRSGLTMPFRRRIKSAGGYHMLYRERDADSRNISLFGEWLAKQV